MRRLVLEVLAVLLLAAGCASASAHPASDDSSHPTQFVDVHADRFFTTAVEWMVTADITTGTSPTMFSPARAVTRGEAAAFVWRVACEPAPASEHQFVDVHASWQQDPVSWLLENNAAPVLGNSDASDVFGSDIALTRAQVAGLLYRIEGEPADDADRELPFTDLTELWQIAPVRWLLHAEITTGRSPTMFAPNDTVSRAEFATFLWRYSQEPDPGDPRCDDQLVEPVEPPPPTSTVPDGFEAPAGFDADPAVLAHILDVSLDRVVVEGAADLWASTDFLVPAALGEPPPPNTDLGVAATIPNWTLGVSDWSDWCYFGSGVQPTACEDAMTSMAWPLNEWEASELCLLDQYTLNINAKLKLGYNNPDVQYSRAINDTYGWFNCSSIVDPDPFDGKTLREMCVSAAQLWPNSTFYTRYNVTIERSCDALQEFWVENVDSDRLCVKAAVFAFDMTRRLHGTRVFWDDDETTPSGARFIC